MASLDNPKMRFRRTLDIFRRRKRALEFIPDRDTCVLVCDASFKNGCAGLAVRLSHGGSSRIVKSRVNAMGAQHAELKAIRLGLQEALSCGGSDLKVLVTNDSEWAIETCLGANTPQRNYIKKEVASVRALERQFKEVHFRRCPASEIRLVDRASKRTRILKS